MLAGDRIRSPRLGVLRSDAAARPATPAAAGRAPSPRTTAPTAPPSSRARRPAAATGRGGSASTGCRSARVDVEPGRSACFLCERLARSPAGWRGSRSGSGPTAPRCRASTGAALRITSRSAPMRSLTDTGVARVQPQLRSGSGSVEHLEVPVALGDRRVVVVARAGAGARARAARRSWSRTPRRRSSARRRPPRRSRPSSSPRSPARSNSRSAASRISRRVAAACSRRRGES